MFLLVLHQQFAVRCKNSKLQDSLLKPLILKRKRKKKSFIFDVPLSIISLDFRIV